MNKTDIVSIFQAVEIYGQKIRIKFHCNWSYDGGREQSESIKRGCKTREGDEEDCLEERMSKQRQERRLGIHQLNRRGRKLQGREFLGSSGG